MQYIGDKQILSMYLGESNISSFSIGNQEIWSPDEPGPTPPSFTDLIYNLPNTNWPLASAHELEIVNDGVNITGPIEFTGEYVDGDETILETSDINLMLGGDGWFAVYTETSPIGNVPKLVYCTDDGFLSFEENMSVLCPGIRFDRGSYSEGWAYCDFNVDLSTVNLLPCSNTYLWFKNSSGSGWDTYFDGALAELIEQASQSTTDITSNANYIKSGTFKNCSALNTILLSMVQTIGDEALSGSSNLSSISIPTEWVPYLGTSAFYNTHNCPIYVNSNYIQQYLVEPSWANYSTRIMPLE